MKRNGTFDQLLVSNDKSMDILDFQSQYSASTMNKQRVRVQSEQEPKQSYFVQMQYQQSQTEQSYQEEYTQAYAMMNSNEFEQDEINLARLQEEQQYLVQVEKSQIEDDLIQQTEQEQIRFEQLKLELFRQEQLRSERDELEQNRLLEIQRQYQLEQAKLEAIKQVIADLEQAELKRLEQEIALQREMELDRVEQQRVQLEKDEMQRIEQEIALLDEIELQRVEQERVQLEQAEIEKIEYEIAELQRADLMKLAEDQTQQRIAKLDTAYQEIAKLQQAHLEAARRKQEQQEQDELANQLLAQLETDKIEQDRLEQARLQDAKFELDRSELERLELITQGQVLEITQLERDKQIQAQIELARLDLLMKQQAELAEKLELAKKELSQLEQENQQEAKLQQDRMELAKSEQAELQQRKDEIEQGLLRQAELIDQEDGDMVKLYLDKITSTIMSNYDDLFAERELLEAQLNLMNQDQQKANYSSRKRYETFSNQNHNRLAKQVQSCVRLYEEKSSERDDLMADTAQLNFHHNGDEMTLQQQKNKGTLTSLTYLDKKDRQFDHRKAKQVQSCVRLNQEKLPERDDSMTESAQLNFHHDGQEMIEQTEQIKGTLTYLDKIDEELTQIEKEQIQKILARGRRLLVNYNEHEITGMEDQVFKQLNTKTVVKIPYEDKYDIIVIQDEKQVLKWLSKFAEDKYVDKYFDYKFLAKKIDQWYKKNKL